MKRSLSRLTGNQLTALAILGYVPEGYVACVRDDLRGFPHYRPGVIYVNNRPVASVLNWHDCEITAQALSRLQDAGFRYEPRV